MYKFPGDLGIGCIYEEETSGRVFLMTMRTDGISKKAPKEVQVNKVDMANCEREENNFFCLYCRINDVQKIGLILTSLIYWIRHLVLAFTSPTIIFSIYSSLSHRSCCIQLQPSKLLN